MNLIIKTITAAALSISASAALASPTMLLTHNMTGLESNAYINGSIPSNHPTKAYSDNKVFWTEVRIACFGRTVNGFCSAVIKMASNTPNPITLGTVAINIETGEIVPSQIRSNGYTLTVNAPGETTLNKD